MEGPPHGRKEPARPAGDRPALLHGLVWAMVPWLLYAAARGVGLRRSAACLACLLGLLVWWGQPCRDAMEAGDVDLLLAALLVLAEAGLLIRYHQAPGVLSLLGVA